VLEMVRRILSATVAGRFGPLCREPFLTFALTVGEDWRRLWRDFRVNEVRDEAGMELIGFGSVLTTAVMLVSFGSSRDPEERLEYVDLPLGRMIPKEVWDAAGSV
jgi:hypothetical protein